ncbi:recombinase family protein [Longirhabdus pacifica]|uniref:recombinase family protein n=1 Tax=Longirhabdus pacifica TaxID=2305227 RepID=UPI0010087987|nr:recombinase family protein [Longirhabdus pacifica]
MKGSFWIYLRKSRADLEAEARGEGETLAKHKKALHHLAQQHQCHITRTFEEIVSGESLIHRPQMLEMMRLMQLEQPQGVLVMDVDRLGRGNMQEQGLILETFRNAHCLIITPRKVYDLHNEFDEEYSEFEAFMARKELKMINRRLQGGRIRSIQEGNYIATNPPYGFTIQDDEKGRYLAPHPEQANVVKMIFQWYTNENMGSTKIAHALNKLGLKTYTGKAWAAPSVLSIIKNAVYIGRIQWKKKESKKASEPGKARLIKTRPTSEWIDVSGKHEPLIEKSVYEKAQQILKKKQHVPYVIERSITNPLAGLIQCDMCQHAMVYRPYQKQPAHLICYNRQCSNKSTRFNVVEKKVIQCLFLWLAKYKADWKNNDKPEDHDKQQIQWKEKALHQLKREITECKAQQDKLYDLLERGTYDEATFNNRKDTLSNKILVTQKHMKEIEHELTIDKEKVNRQRKALPNVEHVLQLYDKTNDAGKKNTLLKSVVHHIQYRKEKYEKNDQFTLILYPKLPNK